MAIKTVHLTWKSGLFARGWRITGPEERFITFRQPWLPWNRPRPLSALSAGDRFQALLERNESFDRFWNRATGGYSSETIRFMFHAGEKWWRLPWELLLDGEAREADLGRVVITRGDGERQIKQPAAFTEPVRIQHVLGDNSGRRGAVLGLERETEEVSRLYQGLESGVRGNVRLLDPAQPTLDELPPLLRQARPDVLWFSGHGLTNPPSFCLRSNDSEDRDLTPDLLARCLRETGVRPVYVVFLACHLGLDGDGEELGPAPAFFHALTPLGVQGLLAMQGSIDDRAAIRLATALFRHLAVGKPLDWAVTCARPIIKLAMADVPGGAIEWARPVVWSNGVPPDELELNFANSDAARRQVVARELLRARVTAPAAFDDVAEPAFCERARAWIALPRLQLRGAPGYIAEQSLWFRLLLALQSVCQETVIEIELESEGIAQALRVWAETMENEPARWHEPFLRSTELLPQMKHDPKAAWPKLCSTEGIVLAIRDNHRRDLDPWFLKPLAARSAPLTLLLRDRPLLEDWPMEDLDARPLPAQEHEALLERHGPLLNAMTVVGMPVRESWLRHAAMTQNLQADIGPVVVDTESGGVLSASVSALVASRITDDERRTAHVDCMRVLDHPDVRIQARRQLAVRLVRLRHCLAAGRDDAAIDEFQVALSEMRTLDRPWQALAIGREVEHLYRFFEPIVSLHLAWASFMTGDLDSGEFWLCKAKAVKHPLEKAWFHGLMSELKKSEGDREGALREIELAIETLDSQPIGQRDTALLHRRLLAYRQDRARIWHYMFYDHARAGQEYRQLMEELSTHPDESHLLAAVRRNYAECLRSISTVQKDNQWRRAKEIVDDEIRMLDDKLQVPILAELLYERARIALAEGDRVGADRYLQRCLAAAKQSRYGMIHAIALARWFWEFSTFELAQWYEIESQLESYHRHGWAKRVAMKGRLMAAKRVEKTDPAAALDLLRRNVEDAKANRGLCGRSDTKRIAQSYAGLVALGSDPSKWDAFQNAFRWAEEWLAHNGVRNSQEVWREVK